MGMKLAIELTDEEEARLRQSTGAEGKAVEEYLRSLIARLPSTDRQATPPDAPDGQKAKATQHWVAVEAAGPALLLLARRPVSPCFGIDKLTGTWPAQLARTLP